MDRELDLSELVVDESAVPSTRRSMPLQRFREHLHMRQWATYRKVESNLVSVVTYGVLLFLCGFLLRYLLRWVLRRVHRGRQGQARDAGGEVAELDGNLMGHPLVPLPLGVRRQYVG